MSSSTSSNSNSNSNSSNSNSNSVGTGFPGSVVTMQGPAAAAAPVPPFPATVIVPNAPPLESGTKFKSSDEVRAHLLDYIGKGGKLVPVAEKKYADKSKQTLKEAWVYRRQTAAERGTTDFWVMWTWPGSQDYELHVHYRMTDRPKVRHINLCISNFGQSTVIPDSQYPAVKKGGIDNPPDD